MFDRLSFFPLSRSKLYMWRAYFTFASRLSLLGGYQTRVLFSDTDSWALSASRAKTAMELKEQEGFLKDGLKVAPMTSLLSRNMASAYLRTFAPYLDFSSITQFSHIYKCLIEPNPDLVTAHASLADTRKSAQFFFKDELHNQFMSAFFSSSPKQYAIVNKRNEPEIMRVKGVRRNLTKKCVGVDDFIHVTRDNLVSKSVQQYSLKRVHDTIFLVHGRKRVLSCFTAKRLFACNTFLPDGAFGYPLHLKKYLE